LDHFQQKKTILTSFFFLILIIFITKIIIKGLVNLLCIKTRVSIHSLEQQSILPHGQLILPGLLSICLGDVAGLWAGSMIVFILGFTYCV
jgi:hypothetical protein